MDHPKPWLRYIDAGKIQDRTLALDGMKVRNDGGEKLGTVDGLIVDSDSGRTYYIVVDAPGWFRSKQFLMPIGQTRLDDDRDALVVNLSLEQVKRFPGFDKDEFGKLSEHLGYLLHRLDAVFQALADPTRRAILSRLAEGESSIGELAAPFKMTFAGASKHVKALEKAGVRHKLITIPGGRHGGFSRDQMTMIYASIREFLQQTGVLRPLAN